MIPRSELGYPGPRPPKASHLPLDLCESPNTFDHLQAPMIGKGQSTSRPGYMNRASVERTAVGARTDTIRGGARVIFMHGALVLVSSRYAPSSMLHRSNSIMV